MHLTHAGRAPGLAGAARRALCVPGAARGPGAEQLGPSAAEGLSNSAGGAFRVRQIHCRGPDFQVSVRMRMHACVCWDGLLLDQDWECNE